MSQPPSLGECCVALSQCLIRITETEKDDPQERRRRHLGVKSDLMDKGLVGDRIIKRKHLFQVRPGRNKSADKHQVSTRGQVTENEPGGVVPLTAQTQ